MKVGTFVNWFAMRLGTSIKLGYIHMFWVETVPAPTYLPLPAVPLLALPPDNDLWRERGKLGADVTVTLAITSISSLLVWNYIDLHIFYPGNDRVEFISISTCNVRRDNVTSVM